MQILPQMKMILQHPCDKFGCLMCCHISCCRDLGVRSATRTCPGEHSLCQLAAGVIRQSADSRIHPVFSPLISVAIFISLTTSLLIGVPRVAPVSNKLSGNCRNKLLVERMDGCSEERKGGRKEQDIHLINPLPVLIGADLFAYEGIAGWMDGD